MGRKKASYMNVKEVSPSFKRQCRIKTSWKELEMMGRIETYGLC